MTSYRTTMREALETMNEDNLEKMRKAAGGAKQTLKMKDGSIGMDSFSASAIMQIYDKINDKNKKTFENMMKNGKKADIVKLMKFAMSKVNASYEEFEEEFELDEGTILVADPKTQKVIKIDEKDWPKYEKRGYVQAEGNELDEAKYELYHKDFSTAMQHAYKMAKKLHGITVDPEEIDDKVASGPKKPSEGKTNSYRLKGDKGAIQVQVYNKGGNKPYELNFYKEEVELDEKADLKKLDTNQLEKQLGLLKIGKPTSRMKDTAKRIRDELKSRGIKAEEVELDEGTILVADPKTQKVIKIDEKDWPKYEKRGYVQAEGNELDEAKYELYHKDFSTAMQHAYKMAKKLHGITVDPEEIDDKVASGPKKPSEGKTNSYRLKGDKGAIQVQVYNKGGNKPYELNFYKEEVEEGAAADARRAMRDDPDMKQRAFSKDVSSTDDDEKAASKNIMMQLRKAVSLRSYDVEFADGKKQKVNQKIAQAVQNKYNSMRRPADKEKFQAQIAKSYKDMLKTIKSGYGEQKESILEKIDRKIKENKNG